MVNITNRDIKVNIKGEASSLILACRKSEIATKQLSNTIAKINKQSSNATNKQKAMVIALDKGTKSQKQFESIMERSRVSSSKMSDTITKLRGTFLILGLGALFLGMQLQKTFYGILKATTSTFTRIMESNERMGSSLHGLSAWWEYLKFVVGSAINSVLTPLLPRITQIISSIANWVKENEKLTAIILAIGAAMGTLLFWVGVLFTPFSGLVGSLALMGVKFKSVGVLLTKFSTILSGAAGIIIGIGAVIAIVALGIYYAWKENFGRIKEWVILIWEGIKNIFGGAVNFFKGLLKIILNIFKGDWDAVKEGAREAWEGIERIVTGIIQAIVGTTVTLALGILRVVVGLFKTAWGLLEDIYDKMKDKVRDTIDNIKDKIQSLINLLERAWGWVSRIGKGIGSTIGIKGYAVGGTVPGTLGAPQLAMLHGGEKVIPRNSGTSFGNINVTVNTTGGVNANSLAYEIMKEIKRYTNIGGI